MRRRLIASIAAAALVSTALVGLAAAPAYATNAWLEPGAVYKFKTTWGGGYVLNVGGSSGSTDVGTHAKVHYNFDWDNSNRWEVYTQPWTERGLRWYVLRNRWSGLCLYSPAYSNEVKQWPCDDWNTDNSLWWAVDTVAAGSDHGLLLNLAHFRADPDTSLAQVTPAVGAYVQVSPLLPIWAANYWVFKRCAGMYLPELKSC